MAYHPSMSRLPAVKREADSSVPPAHNQLPPHNATSFLSSGELEPIPWSQQMSAMGPDPLGSVASTPVMAEGPCLTSSTDWLQPPSFAGANTETCSFDPELFQSHSVPWIPSPLSSSASDSAQLTVDGTSYPCGPLSPESTTDFFSAIARQHNELPQLPKYQLPLARKTDDQCNGKKGGGLRDTCVGGETRGRKRIRRPPIQIQTGGLDANQPQYIPSPVLRRDSTSGISPTIPYQSPDITTDERKPPRPRRRASTSSTTTTTTNGGGKNKPTLQARNRAAASRYRAKTQAASAQLEARERDASVRHQSLLAWAGELRDEVFQLKTELLRHAACDCPFIREYVSHAADEVCKGLISTEPGPGPGPGAGLEPERLEGVSEEVFEEVLVTGWCEEG